MQPGPLVAFYPLTRMRDRARPETKVERRHFEAVRRAEIQFATKLRSVARHVGEIVRGFDTDDPERVPELEAALAKYAEVIKPWAKVVSARMIVDVSRRDEKAWAEISRGMARSLREEILDAPTGETMRGMLAECVGLITSLPTEAGRRVHKLTLERLETSGRAAEIAKEIRRTGHVTVSRANLIARTETARTSSALVQARAIHVGSEGYIWRTAGDSDVRNKDGNPVGSHRRLNGKFIRWDEPPIASTNGERAHAGQIYNCRCYPEPVIPDTFTET